MESPRKFNDCYFYYYSTCTKGDNCVFRHEPSALGCETMCTAWQQGKCLDKRCKLRHMELRKNRKQIPCYWENQPGGCRKKHCPFMHKNPDARTDGIAPSQPAPSTPAQAATSVSESVPAEQQSLSTGVTPAVAAPAPVPLLWQQQRQVVLDSAILGVLPASSELLGGRRVLPPHAHAHAHAHAHDAAPNPYAPLPVDPLVVNFEEESDNESAPSFTPTKTVSLEETQKNAGNKSQEILLLEKIQAETAAFYGYDNLPPVEQHRDRKIVRQNLLSRYDKLSLDELSGKKAPIVEKKSLDFKILSLDEIRARKRNSETVVQTTPITLNLNRKRKLSTQETITTAGNKIIKVVRSNSIVYKKVDSGIPFVPSQCKVEQKQNIDTIRKRTLSEQSCDIYETQEDELVDNCYEFKKIKVTEQTNKPRLIRNRLLNVNKVIHTKDDVTNSSSIKTDDSDSEVQILNADICDKNTDVDLLSDSEIIDVDLAKMGEPVDIVDLSEDHDESDINILDGDTNLSRNHESDVTGSDGELYLCKSSEQNDRVLDISLDVKENHKSDVPISNNNLNKTVPDVIYSCENITSIIDISDTELIHNLDALINVDL